MDAVQESMPSAQMRSPSPVPFPGGRRAREADFTFSVGDLDTSVLRVTGFTGVEGISELYAFEVSLCTQAAEIDLEAQLGQPCLLQMAGSGWLDEPVLRNVHGIVRRIERLGQGSRLTHYSVSIVPAHWYLSKRQQSRIFQEHNCPDMSVPGILRKILAEAGLPETSYRFALQQTYEPRDYVVQYRETDLALLSRLMEEEGIFYFFEHAADGHRMVIGDSDVASPVDRSAPLAVFREATGLAADAGHVFDVREQREIQTGAVSLDDFDFRGPGNELLSQARADRFSALELSDYPGRYVDRSLGERYARVRLEERQCRRHMLEMRATLRTFAPGLRFTLAEHPATRLNDEYLVTHVRHTGRQPHSAEEESLEGPQRLYDAEIGALPARIPYRPPRRTPRPVVQGTQTAIVVGPKSEEIFTDKYGRVKVQFHWDRDGAYDEHSSCWIRVSQGMAGGGYGMMFMPRVGQEVIVDFLEGDPDRPIVVGRVYNNDHMPPYALPDARTISAIRTCSSPDAGGGNEIRFDDAKGKEQLLLYAHDSLHLRARGSRFESTGGEAHRTVGKNDYELVKENKHSIVTLDLIEEVKASKHLKVAGDVKEFFSGKQTTFVDKQYNVLNGEGIWLGSDTSVTLWCQGNFIKLDASGITIVGKMVKINSGGSASVATPDGPALAEQAQPADTTRFGHNTRYDQAPPEPSRPAEEEKQTSWIEIEMVDDFGSPWPHEAYEIRTPEGELVRGHLDGQGAARVPLSNPGACEIRFPNLDAAAWERI